ncbi:MAG: MBOAT family protein, partial [Planctomycetes bacterium]|nr:MBOAT family protein [Planctomycetota bacterium]
MIFNSFEFGGFFASVFVLYWLCSRRVRIQNTLLLAASYFFYGSWDYRFLSLIVVSTLIDFGCGAAMGRRDNDGEFRLNPRRRKLLLCVSLVANLGMLGFFKYYDFFLTGFHAMLAGFGIDGEPRLLNIILPVGISFYTFQTLSYTIDVYRGRLAPTRNLLDFAVFVAFFPQLVAGPIVRAIDFLPQIAAPRRFRLQQFYTGSYLIFWGLFKKIVIADNLAWRFVDPV